MTILRTEFAVLFWLAAAGVLTGADVSSVKDPKLGVGFHDSDRFCIAVPGARLAAGTRVDIVVPLDKKLGEAFVVQPAKQPCPGTGASADLSTYELRIGKTPIPDTIALIGVIGGSQHLAVSKAGVTAVDAAGTKTFRACLADGGVYLTLWSGKPLESELLWHAFRFVDFDMDAETAPSKISPNEPVAKFRTQPIGWGRALS